jgi:hypothetical protein
VTGRCATSPGFATAASKYDFPSAASGEAIPFGIYDIARNEGFVVVGTSHQTPEFAVAAIRRWWLQVGQMRYPGQHKLLIEADCGNPTGNRCWRWKYGLQQLADKFGLVITVTHLPTGASKWNPIEHRLFSQISSNWAGEPSASYETILKFIRTTKTESGLRCKAYLDKSAYETRLQLASEQKEQITLVPRRVLPKYNYMIKPQRLKFLHYCRKVSMEHSDKLPATRRVAPLPSTESMSFDLVRTQKFSEKGKAPPTL